jgi:hypothetical protein
VRLGKAVGKVANRVRLGKAAGKVANRVRLGKVAGKVASRVRLGKVAGKVALGASSATAGTARLPAPAPQRRLIREPVLSRGSPPTTRTFQSR